MRLVFPFLSRLRRFRALAGCLLTTLVLLCAASARAEDDKATATRWLIYGNVLYQQGDYAKALAAYSEASALNANNVDALKGEGNALTQLHENKEAAAAYVRANVAQGPTASPATTPAAAASGSGGWIAPTLWSIVIPGTGQVYNGQVAKGVGLGVLTWGLLAGTAVTYEMAMSAENSYLNVPPAQPQSAYDGPYNQWSMYANLNHYLYIGFGVAYTYTLIDAIICAKSGANFAYREPKLTFAMIPRGMRADYQLLKF